MGVKAGFFSRLNELILEHAGGEHGAFKKFACLLDIPPSSLFKWTKRRSLPSADQLVNFREKLGVNLNWLLTGQGAKYLPPEEQVAARLHQKDGKQFWGNHPVDLTAVGQRLKAARGDIKLKEAADESGAPEHLIKEAEAGKHLPPAEYLYWLAGKSYTNADYLITGKGEVVGGAGKAAERGAGYGRPLDSGERELIDLFRAADEKSGVLGRDQRCCSSKRRPRKNMVRRLL